MEYVGIQTQIRRNNLYTTLQLILFPVLLGLTVYAIAYLLTTKSKGGSNADLPAVLLATFIGTSVWFLIAYFFHNRIILAATGAKPLERTENKRVYNLVENLCISQGMKMPKVYMIEDDSLNAFASGINESSFSITLSRGIINKLDDAELEAVIAHELTHIINRDVRLLIITIIFVGIFSFISEVALRSLRFSGRGDSKDGRARLVMILVIILITALAYFLATLLRFGISRNREYMADAGSAQLTKNPQALASALRKIQADPYIEAVQNRDVAQLFIEHPSVKESGFSIANLFATHPPIEKRIQLLEQFT
ncbi:MAG: M48 family metallopeptidase [Chitinophagales bacterium]